MDLRPKLLNDEKVTVADLINSDNEMKVIVVEPGGKMTCFGLPEHGETTIVTTRGKGYKVKHNIEFLMNQSS